MKKVNDTNMDISSDFLFLARRVDGSLDCPSSFDGELENSTFDPFRLVSSSLRSSENFALNISTCSFGTDLSHLYPKAL